MSSVEIIKADSKVYRFVATNEIGEKIGYAYVTLSHKDFANIAYLESYIPSTGSVLMQSIIDWAYEKHLHTLTGTINSLTPKRIECLCQKYGFTIYSHGKIEKNLVYASRGV